MQTRVIVVVAVLLASAGLVARANRSELTPPRAPLESLPMQIGEWRGRALPPLSRSVLDVLRADDYLNRLYLAPDQSMVDLYIGFWKSQRQGDAVHSPLNCLPGSGWEPLSRTTMRLTDRDDPAAGDPIVNRYVIQKGLDRQLVLYWYQSHGRIVASEYWSKFYLVADAVRMSRTDGAIVRVIAPIAGETADAEMRAEQTARRFAQALFPHLDAFLPR